MKMFLPLGAALALALGPVTVPAMLVPSAHAGQLNNSERPANSDVRNGRLLSLDQIERRIVPSMRGEYLGPEYDNAARVYRLKFIEQGRVTFVDVDATNGRVIRRR